MFLNLCENANWGEAQNEHGHEIWMKYDKYYVMD